MTKSFLRAAVIAALCIFGAVPAVATDAVLTSRDGTISLQGTMLGFDGEFYRLQTQYGPITVDGQGVQCSGTGCPDLEHFVADIRLSGATSMGEVLLPALVEAFAQRNELKVRRVVTDDRHFRLELREEAARDPMARFHFHLATTEEGFADLVANEADIVMATREVRTQEAERAFEAGQGQLDGPGRTRIVGLDALVPVVSPANPLRRISLQALADVWVGETQDWRELIAEEGPILRHGEQIDSGLSQGFADKALEGRDVRDGSELVRHETAAELVDSVARDPLAIGLARHSELGNARPVSLAGACGRQVSVSRQSLKAEDYPLTAPLILYTPARRLPLVARQFLEWLSTPAAELIVRRAGFVDQVPEEIPISAQGDRMANAILAIGGGGASLRELQRLVRDLAGANRLTSTFRFRAGSTQFDPQSEGNLDRLARDLELGVYDDREIILVGFTDGIGTAAANREMSVQRAQAVHDALLAAAPIADWSRVRLTTGAYGETLPLACDDSEWGRQANRRVEVWVR